MTIDEWFQRDYLSIVTGEYDAKPAAESFKGGHGKTYNVEVTALDAVDEQGSVSLDGVGARLVGILAFVEIPFHICPRQPAEMYAGHCTGRYLSPAATVDETDSSHHLVPSSTETPEHDAGGLP